MATLLKELFSQAFLQQLASLCQQHSSTFNQAEFQQLTQGPDWQQLELKARVRQISHSLHHSLNLAYPAAIAVLMPVSSHFSGVPAFVFSDYVEVYGLEDPEISFRALAHFTCFSTAEFAVRPFLQRYPELTLTQMQTWAHSDNLHLRRLASEGTRPRLPWGMALKAYKKDPTPLLPILEQLKTDTEPYVQRSVANHLNDISKDHPELVVALAQRWFGQHSVTDWIIKHGLRGLLKQAHPGALALFGLQQLPLQVQLEMHNAKVSAQQPLHFRITLSGPAEPEARLRLEYKIGYRKKSGQLNYKVFQLSNKTWSGQNLSFERRQSFIDLTTRKHYPGQHHLQIMLNGHCYAESFFELI
ncbi:DNA alkylation repair protein [Rheinheimera soli]|uniref:3-methyladenine DNA glycosylase AlkC n=1 Tax=Rheinheimera soli TaxID=443616 RepID=A0ABU1W106_9GAMM|nr:DNA alkylation repair protein [Rheinheimera soli]MDR7121633.1 3-methyladenine DNA glycosylase AlkC [Rheinheimera soli]